MTYLLLSYRFVCRAVAVGLLIALSVACQPDAPKQVVVSPTLTLFASEPPEKTTPAHQLPARLPAGMVYVPGGYTQIGSEEGLTQEQPVFWVQVKPFLMDQHEVTVGQFRAFVQATGFKTEAETFGDAAVFDDATHEWNLIKGTNWRYPYGPQAGPAADTMPVTQVSWNDARAYAKWAGKRLPHEIEWEHAARNATNSRAMYPFGNELERNGRFLANTWNGKFPDYDQVSDGFHRAAPVGTFGKSPLGLADMAGNVWEWCDNPKMAYSDLIQGIPVAITASTERAQRGGSYLCEPGWCHGYRVSGRSGSTAETSLMHTGFRCVKDV
ncbi:formylglycine-generating enzyme family protein [Fibrella sp. HMF5335]|uniref:Formylglycine-generating enzyme family protein n=1 Tax=Fibrella rubiginis TaxID=2817060 RepID=A0A939GF57_9BACT|nr:SUMF1/EgtB/PvdO family nonheme iron enzyme [Fibrella rubiginis]MBO0935586.1 formylglycine-generating enzyme family protein [Fibrella rubiginis]